MRWKGDTRTRNSKPTQLRAPNSERGASRLDEDGPNFISPDRQINRRSGIVFPASIIIPCHEDILAMTEGEVGEVGRLRNIGCSRDFDDSVCHATERWSSTM